MIYEIYSLIIIKEKKNVESKKIFIMLLILGFTFVYLYDINIKNIYAQTYNNVISFPDVNLVDNKTQNNSLDQEFILVTNNNQGNNNSSQNPVEVLNPDFGLNPPFANLIEGQKYTINPLNEEDIKYSSITVKLAPILFVSSGIKIQDADPENPDDMTLGGQTDIAHFGDGKGGIFIIPTTLSPGNYILYAYVQYPYGITGVFSNIAKIEKRHY